MSNDVLNRVEEQFAQLITMVAENNGVVKRLEQRFDGLEERFDGLEERFDGLEERFDGLEERFDGLEQRFEAEKELNQTRHNELLKEVRNINYENDHACKKIAQLDVRVYKLEQEAINRSS